MNSQIILTQSPVRFDSEAHRYWLGDKELHGITSTLINRAFPKKYDGIDKETLNNAAQKGKDLHEAIEYFDNFGETNDNKRVENYAALKVERGLTTVANEYLVSDEEHYASSIDIVMQNHKGEVCLVDTKTTYTLDKQSTALQLSIYKRFFERQNPELHVAHIYALWLPNKDESICELSELSVYDDEIIDALIDADKKDEAFDIQQHYGTLPAVIQDCEAQIIHLEQTIKQLQETQETLKEGLYAIMQQHNVKSYKTDRLTLTCVLPSKSKTFDSTKFKSDHPDMYAEYQKETTRKGNLKITIKA